MEKPQLINFIAKIMEESGFKVYKNFKTSQKVIDIYAVLPTTIGDFGVVIACKNYDKGIEVGVETLKEMENTAENIKASKVVIVTSSSFSNQAKNYGLRKNIKLIDRDNLIEMAKKYSQSHETVQSSLDSDSEFYSDSSSIEDDYPEYYYSDDDMEYISQNRSNSPTVYKNSLYRSTNEPKTPSILSKFNLKSNVQRAPSTLYNKSPSRNSQILNKLLRNPLCMIILVVIVSYVISFILGNVFKVDGGITGLIEMVVALILSYGLTFKVGPRDNTVFIKGTVIFFVSLIVLILLILLI